MTYVAGATLALIITGIIYIIAYFVDKGIRSINEGGASIQIPKRTQAPNQTKDQDQTKDEDLDQEEIQDGVYMKDVRSHRCNKCKMNKIKKSESNHMVHAENNTSNQAPICFNLNDTYNQCCTINEMDVQFTCPSFCFEEIKGKLDASKTEKDYKAAFKGNATCNKFLG